MFVLHMTLSLQMEDLYMLPRFVLLDMFLVVLFIICSFNQSLSRKSVDTKRSLTICLFNLPFIHLSIHLLIHPFNCWYFFIYLFILFVISFIQPFICSFAYSSTYSFSYLFACTFCFPFIQWFIHSSGWELWTVLLHSLVIRDSRFSCFCGNQHYSCQEICPSVIPPRSPQERHLGKFYTTVSGYNEEWVCGRIGVFREWSCDYDRDILWWARIWQGT